MAEPLFSKDEDKVYQAKQDELNEEYNEIRDRYWKDKTAYPKEDFDRNSKKSSALHEARQVQENRKVQARAQEYLNALIVMFANRGTVYVDFDKAFEDSDSPESVSALATANTPETRRNLHTMLKALTEIPKSWAVSAFIRFLRGTGKQKGSTYHGAGTFGPLYGWKEDEVRWLARILVDGEYSKVLMYHADTYNEIHDARVNSEDGWDGYEEVPYGTEFVATRIERDVEFLNKLCGMLKAQGLGEVAAPAEKKTPKPRKKKQFEPGDIIKKTSIRDLPLPAHVRIEATKRTWKGNKAEDSTGSVDLVITELFDGSGYVNALTVKPKSNKAFPTSMGGYTHRSYLEGATFIGKWDGELAKKELKLDFSWWPKKDK